MLELTIDDGYYDTGQEQLELQLKKGEKFFWSVNFLSIGQYYFYLVVNIKKRIKLKKGSFKVGVIDSNSSVIIGLSKTSGYSKGLLQVSLGKILIDTPSPYQLFIESEHSSPVVCKLIIKYIPIPVQGSPEIVWGKKLNHPVVLEPLSEDDKHAKVVSLKSCDIPSKMWAYYQRFQIIQNYPLTYYAINFGIGNIGIQFNDTLNPFISLVFWKKYLMIVHEKDPELKLIGQSTSSTLRFEKSSITDSGSFSFLIRIRHLQVDGDRQIEYQFFYSTDGTNLYYLLTLRIKTDNLKKIFEFYLENLGNINGHLYQRKVKVYSPWGLTFDLSQAIALPRVMFNRKDSRSYAEVDGGEYMVYFGGQNNSNNSVEQSPVLEIEKKNKLPKLKLHGKK